MRREAVFSLVAFRSQLFVFWERYESMKKHRFLKQLLALVLIAALAAGLWFSLSGRETVAPKNPLEQRNDDFSHMLEQQPLEIMAEEDDLGPSESEATP